MVCSSSSLLLGERFFVDVDCGDESSEGLSEGRRLFGEDDVAIVELFRAGKETREV